MKRETCQSCGCVYGTCPLPVTVMYTQSHLDNGVYYTESHSANLYLTRCLGV